MTVNLDGSRDDDVLMVLDDDHSYHTFALGELHKEQLVRHSKCVCSFFAYFRRGLKMVYTRTGNADIEALMDLGGESRRDRATVRAFDNLLARLLQTGTQNGLERWGGAAAHQRLQQLDVDVKNAERQIAGLEGWLASQ